MEIRDIKQNLTMAMVLQHYGLRPNRNGMIFCPFHDDKNPSMKIYEKTNLAHCYSGNCEHGGKTIDVIDFIFYYEKCSKHQAILKAKQLIGETPFIWEVPGPPTFPTKSTTTKNPIPMTNYQEAFLKLRQAVKGSKKAIAYLKARSLSDLKLEIGFKDKSTGAKIITGMADCLIFPLKNAQGEIVSLYGRSLNDKKSQRHHYLTNRSGLYPGYPDPAVRTLILTESVIDALTIQEYTDFDVLAMYGTNGLNQEHLEALKTCPDLEEVIFFLDGDTAGRLSTEKYAKDLHQLFPNLVISEVQTLANEDPNSLIQSHEVEILQHLIKERKQLYPEPLPPESGAAPKPVPKNKLDTSNPDILVYLTDLLMIKIMGGIALRPLDKLVVSLQIIKMDSLSPYHKLRQKLDLYHHHAVQKLISEVSGLLELGTKEVRLILLELTDALENDRLQQLEALKQQHQPQVRELTSLRERKAQDFLKKPKLLSRTNDLIGQSGVIGETTNRLLMWQVFTSRLMDKPLHIVCLGASGTGKTYLQERVSALIPASDKLEMTALSGNALYYFKKEELKHKLLLLEDMDGVNDDGILYSLRELQSKQRLSKTVAIKNSQGKWETVPIVVEGPVCLAGTTTQEKLYEDNANRSLLIYLDNSVEHQEAIMSYQRKESAGKIDQLKEQQIQEFLKDVQSVLKKIAVRNPYAEQLVLPKSVFKPLRSNSHYLHFIETITFYKQYQREIKTDPVTQEKYIETMLEDIEEANWLLKDVLLAKSDELTKACREFLELLKVCLRDNKRLTFYRKEVREWTRINPNNLRYYLKQLVLYGYVRILQRHTKLGYEYEITPIADYEELRGHLLVLDEVLEKLKNTTPGDNADN